MQRMFNISKWSEVTEGRAMQFRGDRPRVVRIDVNAPNETRLYLVDDENAVVFLALVKGRETLEFHVGGAFGLLPEGGSLYIYTVDGDDPSFVVEAPEIYTRVSERRARNHEFEYMVAKMQANMERRFAMQADELRRALAQRTGVPAHAAPESVSEPVAGNERRAKRASAPPPDVGRRDDEV